MLDSHSIVEPGSTLPGTNRKPPSTATLARGSGETGSVDPRPVRKAVQPRSQQYRGCAEALLRLLVNKWANRHAGTWPPRSQRETAGAQGCGAKRRAGSILQADSFSTGKCTGGHNPPCACSEPHHLHIPRLSKKVASLFAAVLTMNSPPGCASTVRSRSSPANRSYRLQPVVVSSERRIRRWIPDRARISAAIEIYSGNGLSRDEP